MLKQYILTLRSIKALNIKKEQIQIIILFHNKLYKTTLFTSQIAQIFPRRVPFYSLPGKQRGGKPSDLFQKVVPYTLGTDSLGHGRMHLDKEGTDSGPCWKEQTHRERQSFKVIPKAILFPCCRPEHH